MKIHPEISAFKFMAEVDFTKEDFGKYVRKFLVDVGLDDLDMKTIATVVDPNSDKLKNIHNLINRAHYSENITTYANMLVHRLAISFAHLDEKVISQICFLFAVSVYVENDTSDLELIKALEVFDRRILAGKEQDHPVLTALVDVLRQMEDYYGPYGCMIITKSVVEWLASHMVEHRFELEHTKIPKGATQFPAYFRSKSYAADCLSHLIFPEAMFPEDKYLSVYLPIIPDVGRYKASFNDIISFYKETLSGDEGFNYICNLATVQGISRKEAFQFVCEDTVQKIKNIEIVLADHPEVLHALKSHFRNHCLFYFNEPRYRLDEIPVLAELLK